ncbi:hypothetical protein [Streptomyces sp. RG80]|uniref:hypothetical protein n=1 Tax=Streptomyces sp. RG80 TaxID=3157340 RepID=UPI00338E6426
MTTAGAFAEAFSMLPMYCLNCVAVSSAIVCARVGERSFTRMSIRVVSSGACALILPASR